MQRDPRYDGDARRDEKVQHRIRRQHSEQALAQAAAKGLRVKGGRLQVGVIVDVGMATAVVAAATMPAIVATVAISTVVAGIAKLARVRVVVLARHMATEHT